VVSTAPATRPRLPLSVIGGFLGAGKTTLLNRLLRTSPGRRMAVLVNDFGAINIDAELVAASAGDTIALTNGCVCCSIGDDLTAALIRVIEAPLPFDAVVIEASGVSDPWRIAQVALADPALGLDGLTVLVDASACLAHAVDPLLADSLKRQIAAADLLVVNKTDLVDGAELERVHAWLESLAGATPRFATRHGDVPLALLTSAALSASGDGCARQGLRRDRGPDQGQAHDHRYDADHGAVFDTWSAQPKEPFLAAALRRLLREMPTGVLRLKGMVRTDEHGWAELQFAGRHGSLRKALAAPSAGAAVIAIGMHGRLPVQALELALGSGAAQETTW
jgi:G3E family GTPase